MMAVLPAVFAFALFAAPGVCGRGEAVLLRHAGRAVADAAGGVERRHVWTAGGHAVEAGGVGGEQAPQLARQLGAELVALDVGVGAVELLRAALVARAAEHRGDEDHRAQGQRDAGLGERDQLVDRRARERDADGDPQAGGGAVGHEDPREGRGAGEGAGRRHGPCRCPHTEAARKHFALRTGCDIRAIR